MISLSSDEQEIINYLNAYPGQFLPLTDISRRAGGRTKGRETPHWAKPLMSRLVEEGFLEVNEKGNYRVKVETAPEPAVESSAPDGSKVESSQPTQSPAKLWVSPEIAKILASKGKKFSAVVRA
jgi:hypothetical protein